MRKQLIAAVAVTLLGTGTAAAVTVDDFDIPYVGVSANLMIPAGARDADVGEGFAVRFGWPLTQWGASNMAIEGQYFADRRRRDSDGQRDYQRGYLLDMVYDFGLMGWSEEAWYAPKLKPFVLAGFGIVKNDAAGISHNGVGINFGGGALIPLNWHGLAARFEARVLANDNNDDVTGKDILFDYRITAGIQIPLTPLFTPGQGGMPPPEQACELAVVDPITGRSDCGLDSDRDGVLDALDQCPGTPFGVIVDAQGCEVELVELDTLGPAPSASICDYAPAGVPVDEYGCPVGETVVMRDILFENASAVLTSEARMSLVQTADSLKAEPQMRIEIGGHSDDVGNDAYNHILSQQRAESVRQFLISRGVDAQRLVAQGYGSFKPIANNRNDAGRSQNRRVEFRVLSD